MLHVPCACAKDFNKLLCNMQLKTEQKDYRSVDWHIPNVDIKRERERENAYLQMILHEVHLIKSAVSILRKNLKFS